MLLPGRIDVMTDIETLGTGSNSTIIQIAAVAFNINTGEELSRFDLIADVSKNERPLGITPSTIEWWLTKHKNVFLDLMSSDGVSSEEILRQFHAWLTGLAEDHRDVYLWGNGILFDNKMIQHQMEDIGLEYPIFYKNDRDVRTLIDVASVKLGITEKELKDKYNDESLVAHNAYDDVLYQIRLTVGAYNSIFE